MIYHAQHSCPAGDTLFGPTLAADKPVPLFDGKDFTGWEGDTEKTWKIEDGVIVGGSLDTVVPRNEFLCTTKTYGDFELKVTFKLTGDKAKANAGDSVPHQAHPEAPRGQRLPGRHGPGLLGRALRRVAAEQGARQARRKEVIEKLVKHDDWNEYVIRCEGPRIRLWLNGTLTVDYTEEDDKIERTGIIGLQVHGGAKAKVYYKSITIEELK